MSSEQGVDNFQYSSEQPEHAASAVPSIAPTVDHRDITWQASEFIDHQKTGSWYVLLGLGTLVLCVAVYFITRGDILATAVVFSAALAFGVFAKKKPRTLSYSLLASTIEIGDKKYKYDDFRSFSIVKDGALWSVVLQPNKRFMPILTVYFPPDDGEAIFDTLATHLPHQETKLDAIDRLMRKIRF